MTCECRLDAKIMLQTTRPRESSNLPSSRLRCSAHRRNASGSVGASYQVFSPDQLRLTAGAFLQALVGMLPHGTNVAREAVVGKVGRRTAGRRQPQNRGAL